MFSLFKPKRREIEKAETEGTLIDFGDRPIKPGAQFPPVQDRARLARYHTYENLYRGNHSGLFERAQRLLAGTAHGPELDVLRIAVNFADILATKPADLLLGEPPQYESGYPDDSPQQKNLNRYVEENDLTQQLYKSCIGAAVAGDSFIRVSNTHYEDYSELEKLGYSIPDNAAHGARISPLNASAVFPERSFMDSSKFKAINVAIVNLSYEGDKEVYTLKVERHVPGIVTMETFELKSPGIDSNNEYGYPIQTFTIGKLLAREVKKTGSTKMLIHHIPFKPATLGWEGTSALRSIMPLMLAVNDRLTQIDYILSKNSDPTMYGPALADDRDTFDTGGGYIEVTNDDVTPGYLTWNSQLDAAFKELETLVNMIYQLSETPQWLFGTAIGDGNESGTGTSHTDSAAIKARFMPILSKVNRIRAQFDRAVRDALYQCYELEGELAVYPVINWQDGLPVNEMEQTEIMQLQTGGKPVLDQLSAVKRLSNCDDEKAREIIERIKQQDVVLTSIDDGESAEIIV